MRSLGFAFPFLLAGLIAAPGAAQQVSPPQSDQTIIVEGTRINGRQIRDFVDAVTKAPYDGQLGRFHEPVCAAAVGLTAAQNSAVAKRMRNVASATGIRVASDPCTPNILVIVAPDKKAAIEELDHRFPIYFSGMSSSEVRALESSPAPAIAWQIGNRISADGTQLSKPIGRDYYMVTSSANPSRIRAATAPTFLASMVVVDLKAAAGLTTTELADYAAMRTFAATDPDRIVKTGAPTILGVLGQSDDKELPLTLTYWDLAFLRSLYTTDNSYYARYQSGAMEQVIRKELKHSSPIPGN
jgi:hypothetical protein